VYRVLFFLLLTSSLNGQPLRRLGIIDIEADGIPPQEKQKILEEIRTQLADQRLLTIVREDEIENRLVQKNKGRADVEKLKIAAQNKKLELEKQIEEGRKYYLASQFDDALRVLQLALSSLDEAALVLKSQISGEILKLLSASYYFLGNEAQARNYLSAMLDLDENASLDQAQFPPNFIDVFKAVKAAPRFVFKTWAFESVVHGIKAQVAGYPMEVLDAEEVSIKLPLGHPVWGKSKIVLEKEGFAPLVFSLDQLPKEVKFSSIRDRRQSVRGLFSPIGAETPPVELKKIMVQLNLSVVFLGSVARDLNDQWIFKGQWLEGSTSQSSPVITKENKNYSEALKNLISELLNYISPEGRVLTGRKLQNSTAELKNQEAFIESSAPFYKTLWFWSVVAGAIGAGVGTYFVTQSGSEALRVQVQKR
jgi:hypothetical protein